MISFHCQHCQKYITTTNRDIVECPECGRATITGQFKARAAVEQNRVLTAIIERSLLLLNVTSAKHFNQDWQPHTLAAELAPLVAAQLRELEGETCDPRPQ